MKSWVIISGLLAFAGPARADGNNDDRKFSGEPPPASADHDEKRDDYLVMLLGGIDIGGAVHKDKAGALLGGEVSIPYLDTSSGFWVGGYTDLTYDTTDSAMRFSIGPELGWTLGGLDAGFVQQFGGDKPEGGSRSGVAVRPCVTIGFATFYYRHVAFFDDQPGGSLNEFGVLFKYGRPLVDHSGHW